MDGRYAINRRDSAVGQGDGQFDAIRVNKGKVSHHAGFDIAAPVGTPVTTAGAGRVIHASNSNPGGYGLYVDVDHGDGVITRYAHLARTDVKVGDWLLRGQAIGQVGRSGNPPKGAQSHLHFETRRRNTPVNPFTYLNSSAWGYSDLDYSRMSPSQYSRLIGED